jgi:hypothetical protein
MYSRAVILLVVFCCGTLSCAKPKRPAGDERGPDTGPVPAMIVVENVISGPVLNNRLQNPHGLAVDFQGRIYAVDAGNSRLVRFTPDLKPDREIGGYGGQAGLLDRPSFISFDNGLNLMVSDEGNRRISRFNSQLNFVDELSFYDDEDPLKFGYPSGLAFTEYGETWVADRDNNRIAVFSNVGRFDHFLGDFGYSGGQLSAPEKIIRLAGGEFVVCDAGNRRLVRYDRYGNYSMELELPEMDYPQAVAAEANRFWVLDSRGGRILCLDLNGNTFLEAGPALPGNSVALKRPSDMILLPPDRLLISDSGNNRILACRIVFEDN